MIPKNLNQINDAYKHMLINEAKVDPVKAMDKWFTTNKSEYKDAKKVEAEIKKIKALLKSNEDNVLLMDDITESFLTISKQIDNKSELDKLSNILQNIT